MRWLFLVLVVSACDDAKQPHVEPPDAAPLDSLCGNGGAASVCNPLTQTGCNAGCKCGWIYHTPTVGYIGCNPVGMAATGQACSVVYSGGDNCVKGDTCIDGTCRAICDARGADPLCDPGTTCLSVEHVFMDGTNTVAGVCLP